jgi:nitroreductase
MLKDLILKNRSYRRFYQNKSISEEELIELVDLARLSPSARNAQPLKYIVSNTPERNNSIFKYLSWAGYLTHWPGPEEGERPSAYIIMVNDTTISSNFYSDNGVN